MRTFFNKKSDSNQAKKVGKVGQLSTKCLYWFFENVTIDFDHIFSPSPTLPRSSPTSLPDVYFEIHGSGFLC